MFVVRKLLYKGRGSLKITRFSRRNRLTQRHVTIRAALSVFSPIRRSIT